MAQRGRDHLGRAADGEELYGKKPADEEIALGLDALDKAIAENGEPGGRDTRLHLELKGRNPDDGLTEIAYEKGAAFMRTVEAAVGRAFQPVTLGMLLVMGETDREVGLREGAAALSPAGNSRFGQARTLSLLNPA
ncbi:MAG: hypothetical protein ABI770_10305 [Sphingomicrobium sp.]